MFKDVKLKGKAGKHSYCTPCNKSYTAKVSAAYYKTHGERIKEQNRQYNKNHPGDRHRRTLNQLYWPHLSSTDAAAEYSRLLTLQENNCAICKRPETRADYRTGRVRGLAVDHDHTTGAVRELLCSGCNLGIGNFQENHDLLIKAAEYIKKHSKTE